MCGSYSPPCPSFICMWCQMFNSNAQVKNLAITPTVQILTTCRILSFELGVLNFLHEFFMTTPKIWKDYSIFANFSIRPDAGSHRSLHPHFAINMFAANFSLFPPGKHMVMNSDLTAQLHSTHYVGPSNYYSTTQYITTASQRQHQTFIFDQWCRFFWDPNTNGVTWGLGCCTLRPNTEKKETDNGVVCAHMFLCLSFLRRHIHCKRKFFGIAGPKTYHTFTPYLPIQIKVPI